MGHELVVVVTLANLAVQVLVINRVHKHLEFDALAFVQVHIARLNFDSSVLELAEKLFGIYIGSIA